MGSAVLFVDLPMDVQVNHTLLKELLTQIITGDL